MRHLLAVAVLSTLAGPALAQDATPQDTQRCVDVRIGTDQAYGCALDSLQRLARQAHGIPEPDITATSPAPKVGTFNRAATEERMGNTFGHSAFSQRPGSPQDDYTPPPSARQEAAAGAVPIGRAPPSFAAVSAARANAAARAGSIGRSPVFRPFPAFRAPVPIPPPHH